MCTYQVNILHPKADKLLQDLADLELISIRRTAEEPFMDVIDRLREKAKSNPPSLDEITSEVESVRAELHARKQS